VVPPSLIAKVSPFVAFAVFLQLGRLCNDTENRIYFQIAVAFSLRRRIPYSSNQRHYVDRLVLGFRGLLSFFQPFRGINCLNLSNGCHDTWGGFN